MNKKTKGQKFFLLTIISVICIFAFCMAGCQVNLAGCSVAFNTGKHGSNDWYATGVKNSCSSCGPTDSCSIGTAIRPGLDGDGIYGNVDCLGSHDDSKDTTAVYNGLTCGYNNYPSCAVMCGAYDDDTGRSDNYLGCGKNGIESISCTNSPTEVNVYLTIYYFFENYVFG